MKILVIDDDVIARTQLAAAVQRAGHIAIRASDGARGWDILEDNPDIGLVVTDIGMPVMGGDELLRRIRASRDHQRLPVIIITVTDTPSDHARFHQMGASELLTKPVSSDRVAQIIEATLKPTPRPRPEGPTQAVFNFNDLLTRLGGDHELALDVVAAFVIEQGRLWSDFEHALELADTSATARTLNRVKGALMNLGAPRASAVAAELEGTLKAGKADSQGVRALAGALSDLLAVLRGLTAGRVEAAVPGQAA